HVEGIPGNLFLPHDIDRKMGKVEVIQRHMVCIELSAKDDRLRSAYADHQSAEVLLSHHPKGRLCRGQR
ncbi:MULTISPECIES: hypothetical protein, partial [unclassified Neglectibacter]|uniref:hypothetical protein n=1 Tax=unclassified Neglectibacter TaxID=2632164 RepID=UPI001A9A8998